MKGLQCGDSCQRGVGVGGESESSVGGAGGVPSLMERCLKTDRRSPLSADTDWNTEKGRRVIWKEANR